MDEDSNASYGIDTNEFEFVFGEETDGRAAIKIDGVDLSSMVGRVEMDFDADYSMPSVELELVATEVLNQSDEAHLRLSNYSQEELEKTKELIEQELCERNQF